MTQFPASKTRIIVEIDSGTPMGYVEYFISFLRNFRYVKDVYLEVKAKP